MSINFYDDKFLFIGKASLYLCQEILIKYKSENGGRIFLKLWMSNFKFTPGSQCLGSHYYRFAIYPHRNYCDKTDIFLQSAFFHTPLQAIESAPSRGELPPQNSFISISKGYAVFSGIKQSEDRKFIVLRLWNPLGENQHISIKTSFNLKRAALMTLEEIEIEKLRIEKRNNISITIPKKKIITIGLWEK